MPARAAIGTSHGAFKFKIKPGEEPPPLRFDILEEIEQRLPGFPIVLHGASTVMPEYVDLIDRFGGKMEEAVGVSEEQLRRAARSAVCKINIDSDGRLAMTAVLRKIFAKSRGSSTRANIWGRLGTNWTKWSNTRTKRCS